MYLTKTNQLKECKLYHNSGVLTTKNNTFSEECDFYVSVLKRKMTVMTRKLRSS